MCFLLPADPDFAALSHGLLYCTLSRLMLAQGFMDRFSAKYIECGFRGQSGLSAKMADWELDRV
jgi:hypothetical protein